jgi:hypothetical protein
MSLVRTVFGYPSMRAIHARHGGGLKVAAMRFATLLVDASIAAPMA